MVLGSHLIHYGSSTKQKDDPLLNSNSWIIEKDMWNSISSKYFHDAPIAKNLNSRFSPEFSNIIKAYKKLLIYGCGTVSDIVTKSFRNDIDADYASSLPEEIGKKFHGKIVKNFNKIDFLNYSKIFISAVSYERNYKLSSKEF